MRSPTTAASLVLLAGCGGATDVITPPPPPSAAYAFTFVPHSEDRSTAEALGWSAGLPEMRASITPADSSSAPLTLTTDAAGTATTTQLVAGDYIVEAARWLSDAERASLPGDDDALGFAARAALRTTGLTGSIQIEVPASRRKGLVISEWAFNRHGYDFGGFLELVNNGDTTAYLDRMVIGEGWWASLNSGATPCDVTRPFRDDPEGIWTRLFQQLPGTGRDYPVLPGQTVVVATDAIDHRPLEPTALDLRGSDFEFVGLQDADNPAVPNLIELGLIAYPLGHGLEFFGLVNVPFLARAFDPATLTRAVGPSGNTEWARVPADLIVDALAIGTNYPPPGGPADCPPLVNARFDRKESRARGTDEVAEYTRSLSRRRLPATGGRVYLQWTRNGNADFIRTERTPGRP